MRVATATELEPTASLTIELGPEGHVLLLIRPSEALETAVLGFTPSEAKALSKRILEASRDGEMVWRHGR